MIVASDDPYKVETSYDKENLVLPIQLQFILDVDGTGFLRNSLKILYVESQIQNYTKT
jgi:hypothetical protein